MRRSLLAATLCAALLSACGDDSATQAEPVATATQATTAPVPEAPTTASLETTPGAAAPDTTSAAPSAPEALQFAAPLLGGGSLDFTQFAGRTVALWFWAPT